MDKKARIGRYIKGSVAGGEHYNAYVPTDLPFSPPLDMAGITPLLEKANIALGRLDGMSMVLPDPSLFIYMYVRKEAVLSSQIEGTQSSLSDLLLFEDSAEPGVPIDDVTEVSCYVKALDYGLNRMKDLPLSLRLLREIHAELMSNARGGNKMPGEFRESENWLGGTRPGNAAFVPPPPEKLMHCLNNFEKFLHEEKSELPILIKTAIAHVQFETIHPFLDGNGRLGRLMITLILCNDGVLHVPLLYLSLFFKAHRQQYYDLLQTVRLTGDWEAWVKFFLEGVVETAKQATDTAQIILKIFAADKEKISTSGKSASAVLAIHNYMQRHPLAMTNKIRQECNISLPTVLRSMVVLEGLGIVKEITGKDRHKVFVYERYLSMLNL